ncbi:MAG: ABC transporter permease [Bacteroidota bacterium]
MTSSYLKIAWRNLNRNKSLFIINVVGLTLGIASVILISLFVLDELSYDTFHDKSDRIARVVLRGQMGGEIIKEAVSQGPVAQTLVAEFPEVEEGTRLRQMGHPLVVYQNEGFRENRFAYVDANFFKVFSFAFVKGNPATALTQPNQVVITETQAEKFFGDANPIGKVLELTEWEQQFTVSGVVEDIPQNSHLQFDLFGSMLGWEHSKTNNWLESHYHTYVVLRNPEDRVPLESKFPAVLDTHMGPQMVEAMGMSFAEFQEKGNALGIFLQPLTDIHLHSDFAELTNLSEGGNIKTVYAFSIISILILLVACINYVVLATAGASKRGKEVGVKKALGSDRSQLIRQFLLESFIGVSLAAVLAIVLVLIALPFFNTISDKALTLGQLISPQNILYLFVFVLLVAVLAGSYPAFFLSSFKPVQALKNKLGAAGKTKNVRSGMVVFQFAVAISLIIATLVVKQQMDFVLNKNVGFQKTRVLVLKDTWKLGEKEKAFKNELLKDARVKYVSNSGFLPAGPTSDNITSIYPENNSDALRRTTVYQIDENYLSTMGMEIIQGRNFSEDFEAESNKLIINETSAKILGFEGNAIDKLVSMTSGNSAEVEKYRIVGVVKDFHFQSLYKAVEPLIMVYQPNPGLIVKTATSDIAGLLQTTENLWNEFSPAEPFTYGLLDDLYNQIYVKEQKMGLVLQIFTFLSILIGCMGLFALATFAAEQRLKEIGIRKVLGASVAQVLHMLSKDFLKLIVVAFVVAVPLGYFLTQQWLQEFAYRIEMQWWVFGLSGVLAIVIALFTVGWQSFKVAIMNPVSVLKDE